MKRLSVIGLLIAGVSLVPLLAIAQDAAIVDPDDTKGLMDVREVRFSAGNKPRWKTITFSEWTAARTWDRAYVLIQLDTFGKARTDYYVMISSDGYGMNGELFRDRARKPDYKVSDVNVWRPDKSSVSARLPLARMRIGGDRLIYRWVVKTLYIGRNCARTCIDRIPDTGLQQVLLPGVTPSPTPTVTPSDLPTESPAPEESPTP